MKLHEKKESSIHRIQKVVLEEVDLVKEYDIEKSLGEGSFAKIMLAKHRRTETRVVLKAVHQELTSEKDFFREFHYSYHLSPHPNILSSYAVAFKADKSYVFAQEYAPFGDLADNVRAGGLSEESSKRIAQQLASALDFLHSKELAHRDVKLENILVFAQDMSKIKLCDFGCIRREGSLVNKITCTWIPFLPPEIHEIVKNERYTCKRSSDTWQFGIVLIVCLTGNPPWQSADPIQDPDYSAFHRWLKRRTTKIPNNFRRFSPRLLRYFRRVFEHKPEKRPRITEIDKYLKDAWCIGKISRSATSTSVELSTESRNRQSSQRHRATHLQSKSQQENLLTDQPPSPQPSTDREFISAAAHPDSLLYLDDRFNNFDENKSRLKKLLNSYGLETAVDRKVVTKRIWEWMMQCDSSVAVGEPVGNVQTPHLTSPCLLPLLPQSPTSLLPALHRSPPGRTTERVQDM